VPANLASPPTLIDPPELGLHPRPSATRRWAWRVGTAGLALVLLAGGVAGWVRLRIVPVRNDLAAAATLLEELAGQLEAGAGATDPAGLDELLRHTSAARSRTGALDWRLASALPYAGDDLAAVRTVAGVLDDLGAQALPRLLRLADALNLTDLVPRDGRLDVAPVRANADDLIAVDAVVGELLARMRAIGTAGLSDRVADAVGQLTAALRRLSGLTSTAARAAVLLPSMFGEAGPRTYLVLFQNPTEIRATGGMPGAFVVVRADHGDITIVDQGSAAADLGTFPEPVLPLDATLRALYTDKLGMFPADVTATPHFPTAAGLAREMYRLRSGSTVDGVLATDPVALSYLLAATGPLPVPGGPALSTDNAVSVLLADAYARMASPQDKDEYYGSAARAVFEALSRGAANPAGALGALVRAAGERRLLVWSAHPEEEERLAGTVLEGAMPTQDGVDPQVGVFLNDGSGAKLDYYLNPSARVRGSACRPDGRVELTVDVTLTSAVPPSGLPEYVLGLGLGGDPYTMRTNAMVFSPAGGLIIDARLDGKPVGLGTGTERGRTVGITTIYLRPGQTSTLKVRLLTAPLPAADRVTPSLWVTPGVNPWTIDDFVPYFC
jgi:hypothetical protein